MHQHAGGVLPWPRLSQEIARHSRGVTADSNLLRVAEVGPGGEQLLIAGPQEGHQPQVPKEAEQPDPVALDALPGAAFVVFGGTNMSSEKLNLRVTTAHDRGMGWVHSVLCEPGFQPLVIVERRREVAPESFKWTVCRVSTVAELRAAGYDVVSQGSRGHAQIVFPAEPNENDWVTLRAAFGEPIPCPQPDEEN